MSDANNHKAAPHQDSASGALSLTDHCSACNDNCCYWGSLCLRGDDWRIIDKYVAQHPELSDRHNAAKKMLRHAVDDILVLQKAPGVACPYLDTESNMCSVYDARPKDCRIWPLYYGPDSVVRLTVSCRCPAAEAVDVPFRRAALDEIQSVPEPERTKLFRNTIDYGYELTPVSTGDTQRSQERFIRNTTSIHVLVAATFGFALIAWVETLVQLWHGREHECLPGLYLVHYALLLAYCIVNSLRYFRAHIRLAFYLPMQARGLLPWLHELLRVFQLGAFVLLPYLMRISAWSAPLSQAEQHQNTAQLIAVIEGGTLCFVIVNAMIVLSELIWCSIIGRLVFVRDSLKYCQPPVSAYRHWAFIDLILYYLMSLLACLNTYMSPEWYLSTFALLTVLCSVSAVAEEYSSDGE